MDSDSQKTGYHEKDFDTPPVLDAQTETPESAAPHDKKKRDFVSKGEHIHKWSTYLGVDWVFNAFTGVSFAYWAKYSDVGKKVWSQPITNFFTKALKPVIKDTAQREKSAGYGNMFMSIIAGGMFTLPPLLVLENKKVKLKIVKFLDRHIYGKDKVENDSKFQEAYKEVEDAPKKDFWRGLGARFVALAPLLAMELVPFTKKASNKVWFDHVEHASDFTGKKMGFSEKSFKVNGAEKWKFIHESVAMDFGLGVPYAVLHAFFYNLFTGMKRKSNDTDKDSNNAAPTQAATVQKETAPETSHQPSQTSTFKKEEPSARISDVKASMPVDVAAGRLQQSTSP